MIPINTTTKIVGLCPIFWLRTHKPCDCSDKNIVSFVTLKIQAIFRSEIFYFLLWVSYLSWYTQARISDLSRLPLCRSVDTGRELQFNANSELETWEFGDLSAQNTFGFDNAFKGITVCIFGIFWQWILYPWFSRPLNHDDFGFTGQNFYSKN